MWSPSQAVAERAAKRKPTHYVHINLWALVAVLFTLLVAFMVIPVLDGAFRSVDLVYSAFATDQPRARAYDAIWIVVTRGGEVFFRGEDRDRRVNLKDVHPAILEAVRMGAEKKVYLSVDARSKYSDTKKVLDEIRMSGIEQVCFLVRWRGR